MAKLNLSGRIVEMTMEPMAGDEINGFKELVKETAISLKCKIKFSHNSSKFFCDEEGNIAKLN